MIPLVNDLVEHAGIGVLRGEAHPDEVEPHPGHLLDYAGDVGKPPATEYVQVAEFSGDDTQLVLALARQHGAEELVVRVTGAEILETNQAGLADAVAGQLHRRVHPALHADHQRKRQPALAAERQDRAVDQFRTLRVCRVLERRRQGDHHVKRVHALGPVPQEPLHLLHRLAGEIRLHLVAGGGQLWRHAVPLEQQRVDAQRGGEPLVPIEAGIPLGRLQRVERRVGHADGIDLGQLHAARDVVVRILLGKPLANAWQVALVGVEAQPVEDG